MKWVLTLRATYFTAALAGALLYGAYNLVQLQRACSPDTLLVCIKQAVLPAAPKDKAVETTGQTPPPVVVRAAGQTSTAEEMLIWTGNLDGEVGRVAGSDFVKAVKAFQTSLGASPATGELSSQQYSALQNEFRNAQRKWQFQKASDPQAAELWLPRRLLPDGESLDFGRRYESNDGDFSVDVAQFLMPSWTLKRLQDSPCCNATTLGKFEGPTATTSEAGMPGFMLSALDGRKRTSVRAFQRDNVIHLLSISYNVARDKEFRILRNAIASKYIPFGPPAKEARSMSCPNEDSDGVPCSEKPKGNVWQRIVQDP